MRLKCVAKLIGITIVACRVTWVNGAEVAEIVATLNEETLAGYKVVARETNWVYSRIGSSTSTNSAGLRPETTITDYVYHFRGPFTVIESRRRDLSGKLLLFGKTIVSDSEIWKYENASDSMTDAGRRDWGTIQPRGKSVLYGVPAFLSKSFLYEFITNSPRPFEIDEKALGPRSRPCEVLKIPTNPGYPIKLYRLLMDAQNLEPVQFNSYLENDTLYSVAVLTYEKVEKLLTVCKKADTKSYIENKLISHSVWVRLGVEKVDLEFNGDIESFFAPRTRISDTRFSKPLAYHMGSRLPTSNEIQLMLTMPDGKGVARYEAATSLKGQMEMSQQSAARAKVVILVLFSLSAGMLALMLIRRRRRY